MNTKPTKSSSFLHHRLVVGYHACEKATRDAVLLNGAALKPSENTYDWLGRGIYFWEHGPQRAIEYGIELSKRTKKKLANPAVLGAYINLGRCLDLTDSAAPALLRTHYEGLKAWFDAEGSALPENKPAEKADNDLVLRHLDCAVINFTIDTLARESPSVAYQSVRGVFVEGRVAYPGARIYEKTHIQVAVRDPTCILGYFLPSF
jgi:hypothetical protein